MTPQSDQVSRQRAIEAALVELVACIEWVEFGRGMSRDEYRRREPIAWESARAALSLPSETPAEPTAWFIDANQGAAWTNRPNWFQVWPGDPMWSDNWTRYPFYASPQDGSVGHQIERDGKESGAADGDEAMRQAMRVMNRFASVWAFHALSDFAHHADIAAVLPDNIDSELDDAETALMVALVPGFGNEREASTPSARSDIPQDPVFISELSAAGEKSGAVGKEHE